MNNLFLKGFLICSLALSFLSSKSQNSSKETVITLKEYSNEEFKAFNKKEKKFVKFCLKNACSITTIPTEKTLSNKDNIKHIKINSISPLNNTSLNINISQDNYQYFIIDNHNQFLIVKSIEMLRKEFNTKK